MKWQSYSGVSTDDREHAGPMGEKESSDGHFISGAQSTQGLGAQTRQARSTPDHKSNPMMGIGAENTVEGTRLSGHVISACKQFCFINPCI